jgi:hypothetical protein
MDLSFMSNHTALPPIKAGEVVKAKITRVKPNETGFHVLMSVEGRNGVLGENFYVQGPSEQAQQIGRDKLALLMKQTGPISSTDDLAGKEVTVRAISAADSDMMGISLNTEVFSASNPF